MHQTRPSVEALPPATPPVLLRPATAADVDAVADIWHAGWQDAHLGHVPDALLRHRTRADLARLARDRVTHTTVAMVDRRTAWLAVVAGNTAARRFYRRMGWRDAGPFDNPAPTADGPLPVPAHRYTKRVQARLAEATP